MVLQRCGAKKSVLKEDDFINASKMVESFFSKTPTVLDFNLTERFGRPVYLKLENLQATGSFKVRGAVNCMGNLTAEQKSRGVITCSSGNHGRAVAAVAEMLRIDATICVPDWIDPVKLDAMKASGADIVVGGTTYDEAEKMSLNLANQKTLTYVHPFDDKEVIAGQGTVGLEILSQIPDIGDICVPLSGGGLAGGVGWVMKRYSPSTNVIAVSAKKASVMWSSLQKGKPIQMPEQETIANALSGGIDLNNQHTFNLIHEKIDRHLLVDEKMIVKAMEYAMTDLHLVVEGGGAVALASVLGDLADTFQSSRALVVVISGGNVAVDQLFRTSELFGHRITEGSILSDEKRKNK